jgi:hypothetical protein
VGAKCAWQKVKSIKKRLAARSGIAVQANKKKPDLPSPLKVWRLPVLGVALEAHAED